MKRAFFMLALVLLCMGQGFGPKIVKGPLAGGPSAPWTPESAPYIRYYWKYTDLADGAVANWADRIQGLRLTNSDVAKRPVKSGTGVTFSGTEFLTNTPFLFAPFAATQTVFVIYKPTTPVTTYGPVLSGDNTDGWHGGYGFFPRSDGTRRYFGLAGSGNLGVYASVVESDVLIEIDQGSAVSDNFYTNNVLAKTVDWDSTGYFGAVGFDLATAGYYKGTIREIIFYYGWLSSANRSNLHYYATNTYSYAP